MERKNVGRERNAYTLVGLLMIIFNSSHSLNVDTLRPGDSLAGEKFKISKNGGFELGFFSPDDRNCDKNWYIGIRYAIMAEGAIVWVANRETAVSSNCISGYAVADGVLNVSSDGYLGLFDGMGALVWSPNVTKKASSAVILDSGDFVLFGSDNLSEIIWQSFDSPGDSWLPGMKLHRGQKLVPWRKSFDPAPGLFSFQMDPSGARKFVLRWNNSVQYWENQFGDFENFGLRIQDDYTSESYLTYTSSVHPFMRVVLNMNGILTTDYYANFSWREGKSWGNPCDVYNLCGVNGKCNTGADDYGCSCLEGFYSLDSQEWWSSGCGRELPLNCDSQNGSTDGFIESNVLLPDNPAYSYPAVRTRKTCETVCFRDCSCTAFSFTAPAGPCQIWSGDLFNLRPDSWNSSALFVRVAEGPLLSSQLKIIPILVVVTVSISISLLAVSVIALLIRRQLSRRRRGLSSTVGFEDSSITSLRMFSYMELKTATRNFKYKLGSGGFGSVYRGTLTDSTLVAVKKLEGSRIAEKQFRAEISSVGNIHHVNLIRLRGFCAQGSQRLLVYDCMPNGSLNSFLFSRNSENQGKTLDWKTRFGIALGIARALHYLHEKCRDCIIHGDVKPENILLDADYSPRLGDFGLAKLLGRDFSKVLTTTRGTRGYLAPEWISGLPITPKVDVYSFGMTLLEIISGRRNLDLSVEESSMYYFPAWATTEIQQGKMMNIVDKRIVNNACVEEVRRATLVSLLCIQNEENKRPSMGEVVLMLEGITETHEVALQVATNMEDHETDAGSTDSD